MGRVAYIAEPAASSRLDFLEASVVGLWLPWGDADADPDVTTLGARLVRDSIAALPASIAAVDAYANPVLAQYAAERRAAFEGAGMPLFQEKLGFEWRADAPPTTPPQRRLTFRPSTEVGDDVLTGVMDRTTQGTLDRQDRYYAALVPPVRGGARCWRTGPTDDEPDWLVAFDPAGQPVGHALLGEFDEGARHDLAHRGRPRGARPRLCPRAPRGAQRACPAARLRGRPVRLRHAQPADARRDGARRPPRGEHRVARRGTTAWSADRVDLATLGVHVCRKTRYTGRT